MAQPSPSSTDSYNPSAYGDRIASVYDQWTAQLDAGPTVEFLAGLVDRGDRALELGIGTGRVAIPLAGRGVAVEGIDASDEMVARLREKEGGHSIPVTMGDFADVAVIGTFDLVYVPYSTLFALPSQAEQLRCLVNVAAHLLPGGHFVLDAFVPDVTRFRRHQSVSYEGATDAGLRLDVARHDPVHQRVESAHVVLTEGGAVTYPVHLRYAWPAELDALALAAGLDPVARYEDYERTPFTADSEAHVSVYRRPVEVNGWALDQ